jgi:D,D-heptose 1,7-bisphosphate phosphatase
MSSKAVFLDKDGTLVEDVPYNINPELIRLADGALEGLRFLQDMGYQLFIVTNQSGIARGYFREQDLKPTIKKIRELLSQAGVSLKGFYYCPHSPSGEVQKYAVDCFCRKPKPGMLYRAALEHDINLAESWMIGDILNDVEAGNHAGCRTILIDNQHETEWNLAPLRWPQFIVRDLFEAARAINLEDLFGWKNRNVETEQRLIKHD